jgi:UTP--glucose-1-phosphate uridylyltransferase
MSKKLDAVKEKAQQLLDPSQFNRFSDLFLRKNAFHFDWKYANPVDQISNYFELKDVTPNLIEDSLKKVAIIKLNGGLNNSLKMTNSMATQNVKGDKTFLNLTFSQVEYLNKTYNSNVPLLSLFI